MNEYEFNQSTNQSINIRLFDVRLYHNCQNAIEIYKEDLKC